MRFGHQSCTLENSDFLLLLLHLHPLSISDSTCHWSTQEKTDMQILSNANKDIYSGSNHMDQDIQESSWVLTSSDNKENIGQNDFATEIFLTSIPSPTKFNNTLLEYVSQENFYHFGIPRQTGLTVLVTPNEEPCLERFLSIFPK